MPQVKILSVDVDSDIIPLLQQGFLEIHPIPTDEQGDPIRTPAQQLKHEVVRWIVRQARIGIAKQNQQGDQGIPDGSVQ